MRLDDILKPYLMDVNSNLIIQFDDIYNNKQINNSYQLYELSKNIFGNVPTIDEFYNNINKLNNVYDAIKNNTIITFDNVFKDTTEEFSYARLFNVITALGYDIKPMLNNEFSKYNIKATPINVSSGQSNEQQKTTTDTTTTISKSDTTKTIIQNPTYIPTFSSFITDPNNASVLDLSSNTLKFTQDFGDMQLAPGTIARIKAMNKKPYLMFDVAKYGKMFRWNYGGTLTNNYTRAILEDVSKMTKRDSKGNITYNATEDFIAYISTNIAIGAYTGDLNLKPGSDLGYAMDKHMGGWFLSLFNDSILAEIVDKDYSEVYSKLTQKDKNRIWRMAYVVYENIKQRKYFTDKYSLYKKEFGGWIANNLTNAGIDIELKDFSVTDASILESTGDYAIQTLMDYLNHSLKGKEIKVDKTNIEEIRKEVYEVIKEDKKITLGIYDNNNQEIQFSLRDLLLFDALQGGNKYKEILEAYKGYEEYSKYNNNKNNQLLIVSGVVPNMYMRNAQVQHRIEKDVTLYFKNKYGEKFYIEKILDYFGRGELKQQTEKVTKDYKGNAVTQTQTPTPEITGTQKPKTDTTNKQQNVTIATDNKQNVSQVTPDTNKENISYIDLQKKIIDTNYRKQVENIKVSNISKKEKEQRLSQLTQERNRLLYNLDYIHNNKYFSEYYKGLLLGKTHYGMPSFSALEMIFEGIQQSILEMIITAGFSRFNTSLVAGGIKAAQTGALVERTSMLGRIMYVSADKLKQVGEMANLLEKGAAGSNIILTRASGLKPITSMSWLGKFLYRVPILSGTIGRLSLTSYAAEIKHYNNLLRFAKETGDLSKTWNYLRFMTKAATSRWYYMGKALATNPLMMVRYGVAGFNYAEDYYKVYMKHGNKNTAEYRKAFLYGMFSQFIENLSEYSFNEQMSVSVTSLSQKIKNKLFPAKITKTNNAIKGFTRFFMELGKEQMEEYIGGGVQDVSKYMLDLQDDSAQTSLGLLWKKYIGNNIDIKTQDLLFALGVELGTLTGVMAITSGTGKVLRNLEKAKIYTPFYNQINNKHKKTLEELEKLNGNGKVALQQVLTLNTDILPDGRLNTGDSEYVHLTQENIALTIDNQAIELKKEENSNLKVSNTFELTTPEGKKEYKLRQIKPTAKNPDKDTYALYEINTNEDTKVKTETPVLGVKITIPTTGAVSIENASNEKSQVIVEPSEALLTDIKVNEQGLKIEAKYFNPKQQGENYIGTITKDDKDVRIYQSQSGDKIILKSLAIVGEKQTQEHVQEVGEEDTITINKVTFTKEEIEGYVKELTEKGGTIIKEIQEKQQILSLNLMENLKATTVTKQVTVSSKQRVNEKVKRLEEELNTMSGDEKPLTAAGREMQQVADTDEVNEILKLLYKTKLTEIFEEYSKEQQEGKGHYIRTDATKEKDEFDKTADILLEEYKKLRELLKNSRILNDKRITIEDSFPFLKVLRETKPDIKITNSFMLKFILYLQSGKKDVSMFTAEELELLGEVEIVYNRYNYLMYLYQNKIVGALLNKLSDKLTREVIEQPNDNNIVEFLEELIKSIDLKEIKLELSGKDKDVYDEVAEKYFDAWAYNIKTNLLNAIKNANDNNTIETLEHAILQVKALLERKTNYDVVFQEHYTEIIKKYIAEQVNNIFSVIYAYNFNFSGEEAKLDKAKELYEQTNKIINQINEIAAKEDSVKSSPLKVLSRINSLQDIIYSFLYILDNREGDTEKQNEEIDVLKFVKQLIYYVGNNEIIEDDNALTEYYNKTTIQSERREDLQTAIDLGIAYTVRVEKPITKEDNNNILNIEDFTDKFKSIPKDEYSAFMIKVINSITTAFDIPSKELNDIRQKLNKIIEEFRNEKVIDGDVIKLEFIKFIEDYFKSEGINANNINKIKNMVKVDYHKHYPETSLLGNTIYSMLIEAEPQEFVVNEVSNMMIVFTNSIYKAIQENAMAEFVKDKQEAISNGLKNATSPLEVFRTFMRINAVEREIVDIISSYSSNALQILQSELGGNHQDVRNIDINKVLFAIDKLNSLLNELQYYNILTKEFAADLVSVGNLRKTQEQLTEIISLIRRQFGTYRGDTIRYFVEVLPHYMKGEVSIRQLGNIEEIVTQVITTTVATEMFIKIAGKSLSDPAIINSMNSIINMFTTNEETKLLNNTGRIQRELKNRLLELASEESNLSDEYKKILSDMAKDSAIMEAMTTITINQILASAVETKIYPTIYQFNSQLVPTSVNLPENQPEILSAFSVISEYQINKKIYSPFTSPEIDNIRQANIEHASGSNRAIKLEFFKTKLIALLTETGIEEDKKKEIIQMINEAKNTKELIDLIDENNKKFKELNININEILVDIEMKNELRRLMEMSVNNEISEELENAYNTALSIYQEVIPFKELPKPIKYFEKIVIKDVSKFNNIANLQIPIEGQGHIVSYNSDNMILTYFLKSVKNVRVGLANSKEIVKKLSEKLGVDDDYLMAQREYSKDKGDITWIRAIVNSKFFIQLYNDIYNYLFEKESNDYLQSEVEWDEYKEFINELTIETIAGILPLNALEDIAVLFNNVTQNFVFNLETINATEKLKNNKIYLNTLEGFKFVLSLLVKYEEGKFEAGSIVFEAIKHHFRDKSADLHASMLLRSMEDLAKIKGQEYDSTLEFDDLGTIEYYLSNYEKNYEDTITILNTIVKSDKFNIAKKIELIDELIKKFYDFAEKSGSDVTTMRKLSTIEDKLIAHLDLLKSENKGEPSTEGIDIENILMQLNTILEKKATRSYGSNLLNYIMNYVIGSETETEIDKIRYMYSFVQYDLEKNYKQYEELFSPIVRNNIEARKKEIFPVANLVDALYNKRLNITEIIERMNIEGTNRTTNQETTEAGKGGEFKELESLDFSAIIQNEEATKKELEQQEIRAFMEFKENNMITITSFYTTVTEGQTTIDKDVSEKIVNTIAYMLYQYSKLGDNMLYDDMVDLIFNELDSILTLQESINYVRQKAITNNISYICKN